MTSEQAAVAAKTSWQETLKAPFDPGVVKWRPGRAVGDGKHQAFAFVDARDVMERLDAAFGPLGWSDEYQIIDERQAVQGTISVWNEAANHWVHKSDVGYRNDPGEKSPERQSKETEEYKSAYSDAFKRAAVKWGIGRDLYDMPNFELPVDPLTKRFTVVPVWVENKGWTLPEPKENGAEPMPPLTKKRIQNELARLGFDKEKAIAATRTATGKASLSDLTVADAAKLLTALGDATFVAAIKTFAEDVA